MLVVFTGGQVNAIICKVESKVGRMKELSNGKEAFGLAVVEGYGGVIEEGLTEPGCRLEPVDGNAEGAAYGVWGAPVFQ